MKHLIPGRVLAVVGMFLAVRGLALEAGVARADLTPPLEWNVPLGGYGERLGRPAIGVHDRVMAKAIAFRAGERRFVLVTADVLGFPPPVKPALLKELETEAWNSDQVLLLPSHSHTSLDMSSLNPSNDLGNVRIGLFHPQVYQRTIHQLARVIRDASQHPVPVRLGTASMELEGWNRNRRGQGGVTDPELTLTRIDLDTGQPLAVLVNWTAHPTFMSEEEMMFSGGWPGHFQRTLEALIGRGVTVLYYNGAEGDQSPVGRPGGGGHWEQAERYGRELALEAWRVWEGVQPRATEVLRSQLESIDLPSRAWHPDFQKTGGAEYGLTAESMGVLLEKLVPERTHSVALQVGDLMILGVPGEMASGLGLKLKEEARRSSDMRHVVIGGLADEWVSYIVAPEEYDKGGYETSVSFYGRELGPAMTAGVLRGAGRLR